MRSGTDVGRLGLDRSRRSNSKVFDGVEVKALCRPVKFFHTNLDKPFLYGPHFCAGWHCLAEKAKGLPQTVATKEAQNRLERHCMLQR